MSRPATIPHCLSSKFHNKRCCIDLRDGKVHAIKINTNNRNWHNEIDLEKAIVACNPKTRRENRLVLNQKDPFHMLSFGCGADTKYWGRYVCRVVSSSNSRPYFHLEYVDDGQLDCCLPHGERNTSRSYLERQWDDAFVVAGTDQVYEPATMTLPCCHLFPDGKEYSPDVWLPNSGTFIEIKGPPPSCEEFEKCRLTRELGFKIKMFHGAPDGFDCYDWDIDGKRTKSSYASYYRYLHPKKSRKRRRIHNVESH
tara:strand:+ start:131 stop:892 length:762 start_codon:yes stop_codon:yes gene_type:complete